MKGFSQQEAINYTETFSPIAKMNFVWLIFSLASHFGWKIHHMDVKSAFLHGDLSKYIYIEQPPSFVIDYTRVYRMWKSLYGLK